MDKKKAGKPAAAKPEKPVAAKPEKPVAAKPAEKAKKSNGKGKSRPKA